MSLDQSRRFALSIALFTLALIAPAARPCWAAPPPDPAIAFFAGGTKTIGLVVMNADGSNQAVIWSGAVNQVGPAWPHWSPDLDGNSTNGYQGTLAFSVREATGNYQIQLLEVVVSSQGVPKAINLRVIVDSGIDPAVGDGLTHPVWSPDLDPGTAGYQGKLTFVAFNLDGFTTNINTVDMGWTVINGVPAAAPMQGQNSSAVLYHGDASHEQIFSLSWSPDGRYLAFSRRISTTDPEALKMLDTLTAGVTGPVYTSTRYIGDCYWSRTAARIAIIDGPLGLVIIDVNNPLNSPVRVPVFDSVQSVTWSPNDGYIVATGSSLTGDKHSIVRRVELSTGVKTDLAVIKGENCLGADWRPW